MKEQLKFIKESIENPAICKNRHETSVSFYQDNSKKCFDVIIMQVIEHKDSRPEAIATVLKDITYYDIESRPELVVYEALKEIKI